MKSRGKIIKCFKLALTLLLTFSFLIVFTGGLESRGRKGATALLAWPMFRHDPARSGLAEGKGDITGLNEKWSRHVGGLVESSPAIGDIDGDGVGEVIAFPYSGQMFVLDGVNGRIIKSWSGFLNQPKRELSSPAIGDVDGDGRTEIVIGARGDKRVYCLEPQTGRVKWYHQTREEVSSSPTLADINKDGRSEIIIGADRLYVLNGRGDILWNYPPQLGIRSSPAVGDIDGDGRLEIVFTDLGNTIYALSYGLKKEKWIRNLGYGEGFAFSSPALGDVTGDGKREVVTAISKKGIYVLNGSTGRVIKQFSVDARIKSSPAVGDIDSDGRLEVVIGTNDEYVYAFKYSRDRPLWKYKTNDIVESSPAIGDVDGDGELEVVVGSHDGKLYVLSGSTGRPEMGPFKSGGQIFSSPALGDIDGDGKLEIVFGNNGNIVYALE